MLRKSYFSGHFYSNSQSELAKEFEYFNNIAHEHFANKLYGLSSRALVVPHAGYMYSGFTAYLTYLNVNFSPKTVVVVGPSHRVYLKGASCVAFDSYETPFGEISCDKAYVEHLQKTRALLSYPQAHQEHSTEVQFPFIKHFFPQAKVVEIVYGDVSVQFLEDVLDDVFQDSQKLLVISTDLSHFYTQKEANVLDAQCIKGVEQMSVDMVEKGEACGMKGLCAVVKVAKKHGLSSHVVDYRTSGDITSDFSRVVGYLGAIFTNNELY
ncbi:MAG: AmmeMemoRadiSam system protein B [Sulfurospirillaceae bacterium]|nr:AmmeMemoRadiSam system protein B [Sulfurospirillaceae bacterium]